MYPKDFFANAPSVKGGHCFVVMPFAHELDEVYAAIKDALEKKADLEAIPHRADEVVGGGNVMTDVLRYLAEAEVVIVDLTTRNANVFYELGIAHTVRCAESILLITQSEEDVPFDVQPYRYIKYELGPTGLSQLQSTLVDVIKTRFGPYRFIFELERGKSSKESDPFIGNDRSLYSLAICDVMPAVDSAQFRLKVFRHQARQTELVYSEPQPAGRPGETWSIPETPWAVKLDNTSADLARFCVCNPNREST